MTSEPLFSLSNEIKKKHENIIREISGKRQAEEVKKQHPYKHISSNKMHNIFNILYDCMYCSRTAVH